MSIQPADAITLEDSQNYNGLEIKSSNTVVEKTVESKPNKTIAVEWVQAIGTIAVSLVLGIFTCFQTETANQARRQEAKLAEDNQQHEIMSDYFEQMSKLMIEKGLMSSDRTPEVELAARAITLNAANRLDGERKGQLLKLLYEADLIGRCAFNSSAAKSTGECKPNIFSLEDAKLDKVTYDRPLFLQGVNLDGARLSEAKLQKIVLDKAEMNNVNLRGADLEEAFLNDAQLKGARLERTNLSGAKLLRANLAGADLRGADLRGADLTGAILKGAVLKDAKYDSKTKLPGFNPSTAGMRELSSSSAVYRQQVLNRQS